MITIPLQNVSDSKISVTDTATSVYDLMNTASSTTNAESYYNTQLVGAITLQAEDDDIRWLPEDQDPTTTEGNLIKKGEKAWLPGLDVSRVKLIRVGSSNVAVSAIPYRGEPHDSPALMGGEMFIETGDIQIGAVEIKNHNTDDRVEVDTSNRLKTKLGGLGGASTNGTTQLTGANTWVQVPTSAPASDYVLVVSKENEAGTIRWSFENGATPSATNGNKMTNDDIILTLAASEVVYFGSSNAADDVNWSTKII